MYLLQPANNLKHNLMTAIDNLTLLLLTHPHPHFLQQFSKMSRCLRYGIPVGYSRDGRTSILQLYFNIPAHRTQQEVNSFTAFDVGVVELIRHAHVAQPL